MNALFALLLIIQAYPVLTDDCPSNACKLSQTCCPTSLPGAVGCCPVLNAVCCSDKLHCCPQNTICNLEKGTCDDKTHVLIPLPFHKPETSSLNQKILKASSVKEAQKDEIVYCPGGTSYCPDGNTCCKTPAGQYTCCPYPGATCCVDGLHCCQPGNTCCRTPAGEYRCCPLPAATCCVDGMHCCQHGSRCDPTSSYCLRRNNETFWNFAPKRTSRAVMMISKKDSSGE